MPKASCSVDGCRGSVVARGWCDPHYRRWKHHGDPLGGKAKPRGTVAERFWAKVDKSDVDGCWLWTGARDKLGYGRFSPQAGAHRSAYAVAYRLVVGPVPDGLELDHLCRNHGCVNPAHLEPVTHKENMLRGETFAASQASRTHCPQGHPYDEINTRRKKGKRECRRCDRERARRRREERKTDASFRTQEQD